jgi:hypothetical protein
MGHWKENVVLCSLPNSLSLSSHDLVAIRLPSGPFKLASWLVSPKEGVVLCARKPWVQAALRLHCWVQQLAPRLVV